MLGGWRKENWPKISWINCLFSLFMLYVAWKRWLPRKCVRFVLFCPLKKRSLNFLCVLDLFSERWQLTLFQIFLFISTRRTVVEVNTKSYWSRRRDVPSSLLHENLLLMPMRRIVIGVWWKFTVRADKAYCHRSNSRHPYPAPSFQKEEYSKPRFGVWS